MEERSREGDRPVQRTVGHAHQGNTGEGKAFVSWNPKYGYVTVGDSFSTGLQASHLLDPDACLYKDLLLCFHCCMGKG